MAEATAAATAAVWSPADYAFVAGRDAELNHTRAHLLSQGKSGKASTLKGVTDRTARGSSYSLISYARSGVYGPGVDAISGGNRSLLPQGLYSFSSTNPLSGITPVDTSRVGGLGGMTGQDRWYVLRMIPVPPQGPQTALASEGQAQSGLFTPRPHVIVRGSAQQTLTISDWQVDNVWSALPGSGVTPGGAWLEAYVAAWESLATPNPVLGRKPYLALKFGERWWGIGHVAVVLDDVQVTRDWYHQGHLAHATLSLRFSEVSI